jgi:hypothetical protein
MLLLGLCPPDFLSFAEPTLTFKIHCFAITSTVSLEFHRDGLDHCHDCPPWSCLHMWLGHLWGQHSLGKSPGISSQYCYKPGLMPLQLNRPGLPQHFCSLGLSPLHLLLQGLALQASPLMHSLSPPEFHSSALAELYHHWASTVMG